MKVKGGEEKSSKIKKKDWKEEEKIWRRREQYEGFFCKFVLLLRGINI
jgi:hypothetical protein